MKGTQAKLQLINFYTSELMAELPVRTDIKYKTHPNRERAEKLGSRPLGLAELLRMPKGLLTQFLTSLTTQELLILTLIVSRNYNNGQLDEGRFIYFLNASEQIVKAA